MEFATQIQLYCPYFSASQVKLGNFLIKFSITEFIFFFSLFLWFFLYYGWNHILNHCVWNFIIFIYFIFLEHDETIKIVCAWQAQQWKLHRQVAKRCHIFFSPSKCHSGSSIHFLIDFLHNKSLLLKLKKYFKS